MDGAPENFTWIDGERAIRFGEGALDDAPRLLGERGLGPYTLFTTLRALASAPALAEGAAAVVEVPGGSVPDLAAALRPRAGGHALVAFGGGRVIDVAKAIAAVDGLACAAIPTTLSGAEMTDFHRLPAGADGVATIRPSLVVNDPAVCASAPPAELAASAANALAHAFEPLFVPWRSPVTDLAALRGAELLAAGLRGGPSARHDLALGSLLAAYALGATGYAVHHVLSQSVVRASGAAHAQVYAVLLPHTVALMQARAPEAVARFRAALGQDLTSLTALAGPTTLQALDIERSALPAAADAAAARSELARTPDPPGRDELLAVLEEAYA